jgi:flagellar biosynthetic protein FliR
MGEWAIILPFMLLLGRVSAFFSVLPIFSWQALPVRIRASIAITVTVFMALITPPPTVTAGVTHWITASLLMGQEVICGLAMGLAVGILYLGVRQGGMIASRQMGFADAGILNPGFGEGGMPIALMFEMTFTLYFLMNNGHHMLILLVVRSYDVFPVGEIPSMAVLASGVLRAGSLMLVFALQMAAPVLAAFMLLGVVLGILARCLPELNILMASLPIRVSTGMFLASVILPLVSTFTTDLAYWIDRLFAV